MAKANKKPAAATIVVALDFSPSSEKAFDYARDLARQQKGRLVAVHVVPGELVYPATAAIPDYFGLLERDARRHFERLMRRRKLKPESCELRLPRGLNFAEIIVAEAKKLRASLIVMGSHGRTGLPRLLLGSIAERTIRYATCPVLIVKR